MKAPTAIVESVFAPAVREINALERRGVQSEDEANAVFWEQARQVVALLDAGLSQRELARLWINVRTDAAYDEKHVRVVRKVWESSAELTPQARPRFRELYNALANPSNRVVHNTGDFEWNTPADILEAARFVLGVIDLDPATNLSAQTLVKADRFYTREEDGLAHDWHGRVWMNPPYKNELVTRFAEKLVASVRAGTVTAAVAIVNNCTETAWCRTLQDTADALCFPTGRVRFWKPEGVFDAPLQGQAVFYFGPAVDRFQAAFEPFGPVWPKNGVKPPITRV